MYYGRFGQNGQTSQSDKSTQIQLSEDEILLLNLIKEYPDMTNPLLAEKLGWSVSRVKYFIQKLKQFEKSGEREQVVTEDGK